VPLTDVMTDSTLALGASQFGAAYLQWYNDSFWGQASRLDPQQGYVAPPLDGIWATAPFFHNGSVPTIEGVLDSTKRPMYWTRTFDSTDYDQAAVGWNFTPVDHGQAQEPLITDRIKIYDNDPARLWQRRPPLRRCADPRRAARSDRVPEDAVGACVPASALASDYDHRKASPRDHSLG